MSITQVVRRAHNCVCQSSKCWSPVHWCYKPTVGNSMRCFFVYFTIYLYADEGGGIYWAVPRRYRWLLSIKAPEGLCCNPNQLQNCETDQDPPYISCCSIIQAFMSASTLYLACLSSVHCANYCFAVAPFLLCCTLRINNYQCFKKSKFNQLNKSNHGFGAWHMLRPTIFNQHWGSNNNLQW